MEKLAKLSLAGSIVIILLFLSALLRTEPDISKPFINTEIDPKIAKNALEITGVPTISGDMRSNIKKGSYVIQGTVTIPSGSEINVEPDTIFYANRDARIVVLGKLTAKNIAFKSNQQYSQRKYWHGINVEENGEVFCENCSIENATSAVTASETSNLKLSGSIHNCVVGITILSAANVRTDGLSIQNGDVGILALGGNISVLNSSFKNLTDGLRVFHLAKINIHNPSFSLISRNSIRYLNETNLTITISQEQIATLKSSIYDSKNQKTYIWRGEEHRTGTVNFAE